MQTSAAASARSSEPSILHPDLADAGDRAGVRAEVGVVLPLDGAHDRHAGLGVDRLHQHPPHPAGRAGDYDWNDIHDIGSLLVAGLEQRRMCHVFRTERIRLTDDLLRVDCSS